MVSRKRYVRDKIDDRMEKQNMEKKTEEKQAVYRKVGDIFPDFDSMLAFFKDKSAEYRESVSEGNDSLRICRTKNSLEIARGDGYRAVMAGIDEAGRIAVKNEGLFYKDLDGKAAYKPAHGVLRGITFTEAVIINGKVERLGISGHGLSLKNNTETIYLTVRRRRCGCYIATCVYGSYDCPPLWVLRRFRDRVLAATWYGRSFIWIYYRISPFLVRIFGGTEWFHSLFRGIFDKLAVYLGKKGFEDTPYDD